MTKISNLPRDLVEEILSRVPVLSLRAVRSTCKKWKTLYEDVSFAKKHVGQAKVAAKEKDFMVVLMNYTVYLKHLNLNNDVESWLECEAKFPNLVDISKVFHCNGILLCIAKNNPKLLVWNPYTRQTLWIDPTYNIQKKNPYTYVLGYEKRNKSYKILRCVDNCFPELPLEYTIYNLNLNSWKVLDVTPDWKIHYSDRGVSLKGNTYWLAASSRHGGDKFLVCFDFTSEKFGPRLPLPIKWYPTQNYLTQYVTLSTVKEEHLAVLFLRRDTSMIEIWITTKIEPNEVSWNNKLFFVVSMKPTLVSFFINEEKIVIMALKEDKDDIHHTIAYIVGVDGPLNTVDLEEPSYKHYPSVFSYVPSLMSF